MVENGGWGEAGKIMAGIEKHYNRQIKKGTIQKLDGA
ncbi:hypothetical protein HNR53_000702 [Bacillus benzoevorans]|uniref:Uncharacterized protein n=1 Tax=Bacillus benzoevorans TaxID=1456 RepID=A0A7X0HNM8_9BACI|nr:hypothetical protein [Bacillus benzoevorans]